MFIETLEFTIPMDLCDLFSTLKQGPRSNLEFPASVNSYGTTQDANIQVVVRSNKLTFKVEGVSSDASMISKSECKTLKLSVFDVDRTIMPFEEENYESNMTPVQYSTPLSAPSKRLLEQSVSLPPAKSSRTSFNDSPRPRSPPHRRSPPRRSPPRRSQPHVTPRSSENSHSKSHNDTPVNVKLEPEDPDLIEIEPDDIEPKKESPYMQIDYSSDVPHTQTSQSALNRLSHPQSSHSLSPASSSSSFHQNVPHVPDYSDPGPSRSHHGGQSADDFLVFQDDNEDGEDNEADFSNDGEESRSVGDVVTPLDTSLLKVEYETIPSTPSEDSPASSNETGLACPICGYKAKYKARLQRHMTTHGAYEHHCQYCNRQFRDKCDLKRHLEIIHGNSRYICDVCGKDFKSKTGLNDHKLTHREGAAMLCPVCGKAFYKKYGLDRHMQKHGSERFTCAICDKKFTYMTNLKRHMSNAHPSEACISRMPKGAYQ